MKLKKWLSVFLVAAMVVSVLPESGKTVYASEILESEKEGTEDSVADSEEEQTGNLPAEAIEENDIPEKIKNIESAQTDEVEDDNSGNKNLDEENSIVFSDESIDSSEGNETDNTMTIESEESDIIENMTPEQSGEFEADNAIDTDLDEENKDIISNEAINSIEENETDNTMTTESEESDIIENMTPEQSGEFEADNAIDTDLDEENKDIISNEAINSIVENETDNTMTTESGESDIIENMTPEQSGEFEADNAIDTNLDEENKDIISNEAINSIVENEINNSMLAATPTAENISTITDVNTIQVGGYISMGVYCGEPIVWRCVDIDENGPLMLSDKVLCLKSFDAKGDSDKHYVPGAFSGIRKQYGSNCWAESNLREWLNSDSEKVDWSHIRPTTANVYGGFNAYDNEAGFLTSFSDEELGRIKTVTQKVYPNEAENIRGLTEGGTWDYEPRDGNVSQANDIDNNTYYMNVTDKVFVPNIIQLKAVCRNLGEDYVKAYPTQQAVDHSDFSHADFTASKGCGYWTCHVATSGYCYEHMKVINPDGLISGTNIWNSDHGGAYISVIGVRPALYLQNTDDEIIVDEKVIEDRVASINQHFNSAITKQWNTYHEVVDTMNWYDNNIYTEASHAAVVGVDLAANVITVDINGVITQISSNAYNSILLDMYYDLGMNDSELLQAIHDDSLEKAITKVSKPILDFIKASSTVGTDWLKFNEYRFQDDLEKWYMGEYSNYSFLELLEKNGIILVPDAKETDFIEELEGMGMTSEELKEIGDVIGTIKTAGEFIDHLREILCACTLVNMNGTYRQLLIEIKEKASKIEGHGWEKTDLIDALDYEIYYRENYKRNVTWEAVKPLLEAAGSTSDFKELKEKLWKDSAEKLIKDTFKNGGAILDKLSAVQFGVEVGWSISDSIFNLTDSTNAYYKGKAYGVLEEILIEILDDTSERLRLCEKTESVAVINRKFKVAEKFDYAFQMYRYIEKKGCSAYADYEKSFCFDSENWLKSFLHSAGYVVEIAFRVSHGDLSVFDDVSKREILRNYNVLFYERRAKFADNLICHGSIFDTKEGYILYNQIIHDRYMEMLKIDYELAAVLCPVEVDVYNEDNQLVGTVSKTGNTMEKNLDVLVYRNESLDANIIVYPSGYSIKIRGTADGTMNTFGSYYSNGDIQNAVAYYNVPISKDYVADFAIEDMTDYLIDNNSKLSDIKINDTGITGFDKSTTQYNVEIAEGTTEVPQVTAMASNPNALVEIKQVVSLTGTEEERTAEITVTATDGTSKTVYKVTFSEKAVVPETDDNSRLASIKVNGTDIAGFSELVTQYNVEVAKETTEVPQVTAVASNPNAAVEIKQAVSLTGTKEERTAEITVTATDGISKTVYKVTFSEKAVVPETDDNSRLASIKVNGTDIANFSESVTQYNVEVAEGTEVPQVTAVASNPNAAVEIKQAVSLTGIKEERTAEITVTATDGISKTVYKVTFSEKAVVPETDDNSRLASIKVNGMDIAGFSELVTQYNVEVAEETTEVPQVTAAASNPNAAVEIKQAVSLTGTEEERTAEITVTATDGTSKTVYKVTFSEKAVVPETDDNSRLASIKVNGTDIAGFSESVTQYNVEVAKETTEVPQVTAAASNPNAAVEIKQAVSLTGTEEERTAEITVMATDGVSKTIYRVTFDIKVPISENNNTPNNKTNVASDKTNTSKITNNSTNDAQLSTGQFSQTVLDTSPETSDSIHIIHWIIILIISSIALYIGLKRWKKSEYFNE